VAGARPFHDFKDSNMSNGTAGAGDLMDHLLGAYDELKRRLVRKLGSEELAGDALQDTVTAWMRCRTPRPTCCAWR